MRFVDRGEDDFDSGEIAQDVRRLRNPLAQDDHSFSLTLAKSSRPSLHVLTQCLDGSKASGALLKDSIDAALRVAIRHQDRASAELRLAFRVSLNRCRSSASAKKGSAANKMAESWSVHGFLREMGWGHIRTRWQWTTITLCSASKRVPLCRAPHGPVLLGLKSDWQVKYNFSICRSVWRLRKDRHLAERISETERHFLRPCAEPTKSA